MRMPVQIRTNPSLWRRAAALAAASLLLPAVAGTVAAHAATGPAVDLSRQVGPPATGVAVSGSGFGDNEVVDVDWDGTSEARVNTTDAGSFAGANIEVPATATPGYHDVTVTGEGSGLSAEAQFLVRSDWAQFGYKAHGGRRNPDENLLGVGNVSGLQLSWTHRTGEDVESSPAVADGVLYVDSDENDAGNGSLLALDPDTGAVQWKRAIPLLNGSSPAVAKGVVFVEASGLYALDAQTGAVRWVNTRPTGSSSPVISNGVVYALNDQTGVLFAIDASTGSMIWKRDVNGVEAAPAVAHGVVYIGSDEHSTGGALYALDAQTGSVKWTRDLGGSVDDSTPAVVGGTVYVGTDHHKVWALDASTGSVEWTQTTTGAGSNSLSSSPAVAGGKVFIGNFDSLFALDAQTGAIDWTLPVGDNNGFPASSPAAANGVVYVASSDGNLYAIGGASGQVLWSHAVGATGSSPAVVNGTVYIGVGQRVAAFSVTRIGVNE